LGDFVRLEVWQRGHALVLEVYRLTSTMPREERYGLASQLRRAALSITSNIAEGCGRNTSGEMQQFLRYALGSANELQNQLIVARDLGYLASDQWKEAHDDTTRVRQMLSALIRRLRSTPAQRIADSG